MAGLTGKGVPASVAVGDAVAVSAGSVGVADAAAAVFDGATRGEGVGVALTKPGGSGVAVITPIEGRVGVAVGVRVTVAVSAWTVCVMAAVRVAIACAVRITCALARLGLPANEARAANIATAPA